MHNNHCLCRLISIINLPMTTHAFETTYEVNNRARTKTLALSQLGRQDDTCMFVLVMAVSHSPATEMTSRPCDIWLKYRGCATAEHHTCTSQNSARQVQQSTRARWLHVLPDDIRKHMLTRALGKRKPPPTPKF